MSDHSLAGTLPLPPVRPAPARASAAHALRSSLLLVTGFWWLATGVIVALQRDAGTRAFAALLATALALFGAWLIFRRRDDLTPAGARASLIGGSLLWAWVSMTFYGGWIVGPGVAPGAITAPGQPSLALALEAIRATSHNEAAGLGCLALAWLLCRSHPNRLGFLAMAGFWGTHQVAKLNIFFGVANPATRFLPDRLSFLTLFFGPERNTPLLWVSVAALTALSAWLIRRAARADTAFAQHGAALLGVLIGLAALEHLLLGARWDAPLWDLFLHLRGE